jgi:hypothetical protein
MNGLRPCPLTCLVPRVRLHAPRQRIGKGRTGWAAASHPATCCNFGRRAQYGPCQFGSCASGCAGGDREPESRIDRRCGIAARGRLAASRLHEYIPRNRRRTAAGCDCDEARAAPGVGPGSLRAERAAPNGPLVIPAGCEDRRVKGFGVAKSNKGAIRRPGRPSCCVRHRGCARAGPLAGAADRALGARLRSPRARPVPPAAATPNPRPANARGR